MKQLSHILLATLIGCYAGIAHGSTSDIDCYTSSCPDGTRCLGYAESADKKWEYFCVDNKDGTLNNKCTFGEFCDLSLECQRVTKICKTRQDIDRDNACLDATRPIMVAIKNDYQTTGVTTRSAKVADTLMVLDDFSTNSVDNLGYQFACTDKGGTYVELHYNATCEAPAVGRNKKIAKIFVAGQPRCYSKTSNQTTCGLALLHEFSLRPTEDRADLESHSTEKWTCKGTLRAPSLSLCNDLSTSIMKTRGMAMATLGMKPVIQVQKSVGLVKEEKLMTFTGHDPARFTKACEVGGGVPYEADGRLACGISKYDVKKYPTCLWALCGGASSSDAQAVIESQLHDRLVAAGQIKNKTSCKFSSALRLHASVASGAFLSMLFMTIGIMVL